LDRWQRSANQPAVRGDDDAMRESARAIIALSSDVRPDEVAAYLGALCEHGSHDDQEAMFALLGPTSVDLPDDVVKFGLQLLIARPNRHYSGELDHSDLGLRPHLYYPASDLQGPFLSILHHNAGAGLELVRRLADRAVEFSQERLRREHFRNLEFRLLDGSVVQLLGDEQAYVWFRPRSSFSAVLTSALMAVETWALQRLQAGDKAADVVLLLLRDARCVAFLGITVGLGYDIPAVRRELVDAVARPWFWRLERARYASDQMVDYDAFLPEEFRFLGAYKPHLHERNRSRDAQRTQQRQPILYTINYFFDGATDLRDQFLSRCAEQRRTDAALFIEEASQAERSVPAGEAFEDFQVVTNPDNYQDLGDSVLFTPPVSDGAEATLRAATLRQAMMQYNLIGANLLREYRSQKLEHASAFQDFGEYVQREIDSGHVAGEDMELARDVRVRCAAVAVTQLPRVGVSASTWARDVIRQAARDLDIAQWEPQREASDVTDLRVSVATALGAMVAAESDDEQLRCWTIRTAGMATYEVAASVLRGLIPAWRTCPEIPMNVLVALLRVAIQFDRQTQRLAADEIEQLIRLTAGGTASELPELGATLTRSGAFLIDVALSAMPGGYENQDAVNYLYPLALQLAERVQRQDGDEYNEGLYKLRWSLGPFCANLLISAPMDAYNQLLTVFSDWTRSLSLYGRIVRGIVGHLRYTDTSEQTFQRFFDLAAAFLNADHRAAMQREYLSSELRDACWHLIFVQDAPQNANVLPDDWSLTSAVIGYIDRWVEAVGCHPTNTNALLAFLEPRYAAFTPAAIVGWLETCARNTPSTLQATFWNDCGLGIGQALAAVLQDPRKFGPEVLARIGALIDSMVAAGVRSGGELRRRFEAVRAS
jgi:hypothetical protein